MKINWKVKNKIIVSWILLVISCIIIGPAIQEDYTPALWVGLPFFILAFIVLFSASDKPWD